MKCLSHLPLACSKLHRILHNRIYIGDVRYQGEWYPGKFEPLIDRATFHQVQDKFGTDFKVYHKPQLTFAGGLITCAYCEHVVTGEKKIKTSPDGTPHEYSSTAAPATPTPGIRACA